jgi:hypothetical protein
MNDKASTTDKVFVAIVCMIVIIVLLVAIRYTFKDGGFHKKTFEGHTYIFYGDKPIEHDIECKKCLDKFD